MTAVAPPVLSARLIEYETLPPKSKIFQLPSLRQPVEARPGFACETDSPHRCIAGGTFLAASGGFLRNRRAD
jgi:hypothetical protein